MFLVLFLLLDFQATGEAAGEDVESDSDSDDDDDDVRVTIGDIKTGAPQYTYVWGKLCCCTYFYSLWLVYIKAAGWGFWFGDGSSPCLYLPCDVAWWCQHRPLWGASQEQENYLEFNK